MKNIINFISKLYNFFIKYYIIVILILIIVYCIYYNNYFYLIILNLIKNCNYYFINLLKIKNKLKFKNIKYSFFNLFSNFFNFNNSKKKKDKIYYKTKYNKYKKKSNSYKKELNSYKKELNSYKKELNSYKKKSINYKKKLKNIELQNDQYYKNLNFYKKNLKGGFLQDTVHRLTNLHDSYIDLKSMIQIKIMGTLIHKNNKRIEININQFKSELAKLLNINIPFESLPDSQKRTYLKIEKIINNLENYKQFAMNSNIDLRESFKSNENKTSTFNNFIFNAILKRFNKDQELANLVREIELARLKIDFFNNNAKNLFDNEELDFNNNDLFKINNKKCNKIIIGSIYDNFKSTNLDQIKKDQQLITDILKKFKK